MTASSADDPASVNEIRNLYREHDALAAELDKLKADYAYLQGQYATTREMLQTTKLECDRYKRIGIVLWQTMADGKAVYDHALEMGREAFHRPIEAPSAERVNSFADEVRQLAQDGK